jgi:hypothetical protein
MSQAGREHALATRRITLWRVRQEFEAGTWNAVQPVNLHPGIRTGVITKSTVAGLCRGLGVVQEILRHRSRSRSRNRWLIALYKALMPIIHPSLPHLTSRLSTTPASHVFPVTIFQQCSREDSIVSTPNDLHSERKILTSLAWYPHMLRSLRQVGRAHQCQL